MPSELEKAAITDLMSTVQRILTDLMTSPEKFDAGVSSLIVFY